MNDDNFEKNNCGCGHNHEEDGCGCGHEHGLDHECECEMDLNFLNLKLDDGRELKCGVLGTFEALDDEYIALLPEGTEDVLIYSFVENEEGLDLKAIESEEEFNEISKVFMELYGEENFEEEEE